MELGSSTEGGRRGVEVAVKGVGSKVLKGSDLESLDL